MRAGCEQHASAKRPVPSYITADRSQVVLAVVLLDALYGGKFVCHL
jgi:hypothetical protein